MDIACIDDDEYVSDDLRRKELLTKNYEFKLGMEFNALVEFKNAIRECWFRMVEKSSL